MALKIICVLLAFAMVCNGLPYYYGEDNDMSRGNRHGNQGFGSSNQGPGYGSQGGQGPQGFDQGYGNQGRPGNQGFGSGNQGSGFPNQGGYGNQGYGSSGNQGGHRKGYQEYGY